MGVRNSYEKSAEKVKKVCPSPDEWICVILASETNQNSSGGGYFYGEQEENIISVADSGEYVDRDFCYHGIFAVDPGCFHRSWRRDL